MKKINVRIWETESPQNENNNKKIPTKDTLQLLKENWIGTIQTQIKAVQRLFILLSIKAHSTSCYSMKNLIGNICILVFFLIFKRR